MPISSKRDSEGLVDIHHPRLPNGRVNWRAMISPSNLYVNPDFEEELKARFNVKSRRDIDPTQVEDNQLLVTLGGWQELLRLRGYNSLRYPILTSRDGSVSATCEIEFIGNYETEGRPVTHSEAAGASLYSVSGKFQLYLEAMATNAAFARCVRTFLNVPIYGKDEFDPEANKSYEAALKKGESPITTKTSSTPVEVVADLPHDVKGLLKMKCSQKKITFEALVKGAIKYEADLVSKPSEWTSFESIPPKDCYTLMTKIEKAK